MSARAALEPLVQVFGVDAIERDGGLTFRTRGAGSIEIDHERLADGDKARLSFARESMEGEPARVRLRFVDTEANHEPGVVLSVGSAQADILDVEAPIAMDRAQAQACANGLAKQIELAADQTLFAMAADGLIFEAGDAVSVQGRDARIVQITHGTQIGFEAVLAGDPLAPVVASGDVTAPAGLGVGADPYVVIVDAPALPGMEDDLRPIGFAFADPWLGPMTFSAGPGSSALSERGRIERPCTVGVLVSELHTHVSGRWQEVSVWVRAYGDSLSSRTEAAVLNGANVAFVETEAGWQMIQYQQAELVDVNTYRLSGLLRGQQGSDEAMQAGAASAARVVFLTGAERRLDVADWEHGLELEWRVGRDSSIGGGTWTGSYLHQPVAGVPWSPCHLTATPSGGDVALAWVRRARKGGDAWGAGEPVNESTEAYRVRISGGVSSREWDVTEASAVYAAGDQATDFPGGGTALVEVAQLAANGEPGGRTSLELIIPPP